MDFGINIAPAADSWKVVQRAEELGFTHAWFYDTQLLNADVFVAMAAAAMRTSRIRLGTGVLIPSNRIAPVTANALASLNRLAPGRIDFGVSTGFTARRTMGVRAMGLADMEEYIRVVAALLEGQTVAWEFEGAARKIRFLNPEIGAIDIDHDIPVHISALGPKGRALTARLGRRWINTVRDAAEAAAALDQMRRQWRQAGHDQSALYATAIAGGCVLADGEEADSERAKAEAGPAASMVLHNLAEAAELGDLGYRMPEALEPALAAYIEIYRGYQPADARYLSNHRGHLMFLRPEEEPLITAAMIRALTLTGTADELRGWIRALETAGYSQFAPHIRHGHESMLEDWAAVIDGL